jgi:hypothetical protein
LINHYETQKTKALLDSMFTPYRELLPAWLSFMRSLRLRPNRYKFVAFLVLDGQNAALVNFGRNDTSAKNSAVIFSNNGRPTRSGEIEESSTGPNKPPHRKSTVITVR